jgi:glycosyltransferase involved in cell wall biosynthesis
MRIRKTYDNINDMKLVVMIPSLNEERTIEKVIKLIPPAKSIEGIDTVIPLVIDDGSTDDTAKLAKKAGAKVVSHKKNEGLGIAFQTGIDKALEMGADVICNIDADLQFNPKDIPILVKPIVENGADMVTATRFKEKEMIPKNISPAKLWGNKKFTLLVNKLTGENFTDTQCGFRAYSREAAMRLNLFGRFTYTQEAFIDLINKGMKIKEVSVKVKYHDKPFRKSKISGDLFNYGMRAMAIVLRTFRDYKPLVFFGIPGVAISTPGFILAFGSLIYWLVLGRTSPVRMYLFTGIVLILFGLLLIILALIADMFKRLRRNQEEILYRLKNYE